jgi:hypothetical protein
VWNSVPIPGSIAAEEFSFEEEVFLRFGDKKSHKANKLILSCGELLWTRGKNISSCHMNSIVEVIVQGNKVKCLGVQSFTFKFSSPQIAISCGQKLRQCLQFISAQRCLWRVAELILTDKTGEPRKILQLTSARGTIWSLDTNFNVTEWDLELDLSGLMRGARKIVPCRFLRIDGNANFISFSLPKSILGVGDKIFAGLRSSFVSVICPPFGDPLRVENRNLKIENQRNEVTAASWIGHEISKSSILNNGRSNSIIQNELWCADNEGNFFIYDVETFKCLFKRHITSFKQNCDELNEKNTEYFIDMTMINNEVLSSLSLLPYFVINFFFVVIDVVYDSNWENLLHLH